MNDTVLQNMYAYDNFSIIINEDEIPLAPTIINPLYQVYTLEKNYKIHLKIKKSVFNANCEERDLLNNHLLTMCLSDTLISYGDEERTKQEHIYDQTIYYNQLTKESYDYGDFLIYDISDMIHLNQGKYVDGVINNMFFTTKKARLYHYEKHSKNAFYHIQAINLPFHNFLFYYNK